MHRLILLLVIMLGTTTTTTHTQTSESGDNIRIDIRGDNNTVTLSETHNPTTGL